MDETEEDGVPEEHLASKERMSKQLKDRGIRSPNFLKRRGSPRRSVRRLLGAGSPCDEIPSREGASSLAYVPRVRLILTPPKRLEKSTSKVSTLDSKQNCVTVLY